MAWYLIDQAGDSQSETINRGYVVNYLAIDITSMRRLIE